MLTIHSTKKLLDELKRMPCDITEERSFFSWYANLLTLNRRKSVLLLNEHSRYPILIYGLKAPNFKQIDKQIADAIKTIFFAENMASDVVNKYLDETRQIAYAKTSNRSVVAAMNQVAQMLSYYDTDEFDQDNFVQTDISMRLGKGITKRTENTKSRKKCCWML